MIRRLHRPNRFYRRLSKVVAYVAYDYRLTSKAIGPIMNAELADVRTAIRDRKSAEVSK